MSFRGIVFDLDGTLLNSLPDIAEASNVSLRKRGFPEHSVDAYKDFIGNGVAWLVHQVLPHDNPPVDLVDACVSEFSSNYAALNNAGTKPYAGVPELLTELNRRSVKLGILSNKPHQLTGECVAVMLPDWRFDAVFGQRDNVPRKPDPAGAIEIAEVCDIPVTEFLYVGDTGVDMQTGVAAGMHPVGVEWGFRSRDELKRDGAKNVISEPSELLDLLL